MTWPSAFCTIVVVVAFVSLLLDRWPWEKKQ
jgi:hypothetical protein